MDNFRCDFARCYRNDYSVPGGTNTFQPVRQFNQTSGAPKERTQSLRTAWQDTPWLQTGPRVNILGFSDFAGQPMLGPVDPVELEPQTDGWTISGDTFLAGFGKWGAFAEANISPSPEAFYIALLKDTKLENILTAIDLNLPIPMTTDPASKVVTYQCLCKVKGKMRFALENSDDGVLDEIVIESPVVSTDYQYTDTTLVTLRAQVFEGGAPESVRYAVVVIENVSDASIDSDVSALQVYWQQAWGGSEAQTDYPLAGGLANAGQVRTPTADASVNTYNWAVNALGIKAASRFQLPLLNTATGEDAAGMGWRSLVTAADYELADGEMYADQNILSVLGRLDETWFQFVQPERVLSISADVGWDATKEKNVIITGTTSRTVTLDTDQTLIPQGSIVRVFNLGMGLGMTVTVKVGTTTFSTLALQEMGEFLFYVDSGGNSKWLMLQEKLKSIRLP